MMTPIWINLVGVSVHKLKRPCLSYPQCSCAFALALIMLGHIKEACTVKMIISCTSWCFSCARELCREDGMVHCAKNNGRQ